MHLRASLQFRVHRMVSGPGLHLFANLLLAELSHSLTTPSALPLPSSSARECLLPLKIQGVPPTLGIIIATSLRLSGREPGLPPFDFRTKVGAHGSYPLAMNLGPLETRASPLWPFWHVIVSALHLDVSWIF